MEEKWHQERMMRPLGFHEKAYLQKEVKSLEGRNESRRRFFGSPRAFTLNSSAEPANKPLRVTPRGCNGAQELPATIRRLYAVANTVRFTLRGKARLRYRARRAR